MAKFRIESQITLLAIIIAAAVITSGFFAWKSLSNIVESIHEEARPDNRLFLLKNIANELSAIENNARLYILTDNDANLETSDSLQSNITKDIRGLYAQTPPEHASRELVDSFRFLAISKVKLWNGVINLHQNVTHSGKEFSEIYEKLEEPKLDTTITITEKKSIFRRIFGAVKTVADTTVEKRQMQEDEIREQIEELQQEMSERDEQVNLLESNLIERNIIITKKINQLIQWAEQNQAQSLIQETEKADRLATVTYKRLAGFSVAAVLLLLLVLFILYQYLSKRRTYEKGLKRARQEAENLAQAKEQFAANVSHEMRTPVNAIYGLAEQLLRRRDNENINEQISVLAQSASHLNQIINDTLDFTKVQTGKIRFEKVHFSPEQLFHEIQSLQKYSALQKGISLNFIIDENLPVALVGDPLRLKQILINLIGNAIKFTDSGEVVFKAKATKNEEKSVLLKMQVSDTGIGISKTDQKIIFNEFVQAENRNGKKYRGTGLGLTIVKRLVELQQGQIELESEPGTGTTINLSVPYSIGDAAKIERSDLAAPEIPEYLKEIRVLVADDEEFNRFLYRAVFNKWNIRYSEATNGEEAVAAAITRDFDIVLMDMRMPKKDGLQAAKEILREKPALKIIAVTANENKKVKQDCVNAGIAGFLPKPFSEEQLFSVLHSNIKTEKKQSTSGKKPGYISKMETMAGGDKKFLNEMMSLFISSTENAMNDISLAIEKKNWQQVADSAHSIAPQCKQIGETELYSKLKELEKISENAKGNENRITALYGEINNKIETMNRKLKNYLSDDAI